MPSWGRCTQPADDSSSDADADSADLAELAQLVEIANAADKSTAEDSSSDTRETAVTPATGNTTSTSAAAADPGVDAGSKGLSTGGIVGAASGGVGVLAALLGAAYTCWKWWHKRRAIKVRLSQARSWLLSNTRIVCQAHVLHAGCSRLAHTFCQRLSSGMLSALVQHPHARLYTASHVHCDVNAFIGRRCNILTAFISSH
jgi:hypothetical protein